MRTKVDVAAAKQQVENAVRMAAWVDVKREDARKRKGKRTLRDMGAFRRSSEEAIERVEAGDWADARPAVLVGLYCVLHERVYGVPAVDCADAWIAAVGACKRMLGDAPFEGSVASFVAFMRWAWSAEHVAEQATRGTNKSRRRLTWRLLFGTRCLLVDYLRRKVAKAAPRVRAAS